MTNGKIFEERERAIETHFAHEEDVRHINDIKEVGLEGAKIREIERQVTAGVRPSGIKPDAIKQARTSAVDHHRV